MKDIFKRGYRIFRDNITWEDILSCNPNFHINYIIKEYIGAKKGIVDNTLKKQKLTPQTNSKLTKRIMKSKSYKRFNNISISNKQTQNLIDHPQSQPITLAKYK